MRPGRALNITPDGAVTENSSANSAAPGDYVVLYGTGFGPVNKPAPDGQPRGEPAPFPQTPGFTLDGRDVTGFVSYAGRAPRDLFCFRSRFAGHWLVYGISSDTRHASDVSESRQRPSDDQPELTGHDHLDRR